MTDRVPPVPAAGTYLTDGVALFHVESILARTCEDVLLELENCTTSELLVCSARRLSAVGLRLVRAA